MTDGADQETIKQHTSLTASLKIVQIAMNLTNRLMSATGGREKIYAFWAGASIGIRSAIANQLELECEELITG